MNYNHKNYDAVIIQTNFDKKNWTVFYVLVVIIYYIRSQA